MSEMLGWLAVDPMLLVGGLVAVFGLVFALYLVLERDGQAAAQKTTQKVGGVGIGAAGVGAAVAVEGVQLLAEVPGIVITMLGVGSILAGVDWEVFAAVAFVVFIVAKAVEKPEEQV